MADRKVTQRLPTTKRASGARSPDAAPAVRSSSSSDLPMSTTTRTVVRSLVDPRLDPRGPWEPWCGAGSAADC